MTLPTPYYDDGKGIVIYHGDCRDILPELPDGSVDLVLTDPPYGIRDVPLLTGGRDPRRRRDNTYHPPSTWDTDFPSEHAKLVGQVADVVAWFGNWRKRTEAEAAIGMPIRCEIVWAKDMHTGPPCPAAMQDERMWVFADHGIQPKCFETTIWQESVIPTWKYRYHRNQKPVSLLLRALRWLPGGAVVDPFMGSGTTLVAAKRMGMPAIGIEIEERYCEIAAKRLAQGVLEFSG